MMGVLCGTWLLMAAVGVGGDGVRRHAALADWQVAQADPAEAARLRAEATRTLVHALGDSPFTRVNQDDHPGFAADRPWCVRGACAVEFARSQDALVVLSGQLTVTPEGVREGVLTLHDAHDARLLSTRPFSGGTEEAARAQAHEAARLLAQDLLAMDREATAAMQRNAPPAPTAPRLRDHADMKPALETVRAPDHSINWYGMGAAAAGAVPVVVASHVGLLLALPLLLIPGVNVLVVAAYLAHPALAAAVGWLSGTRMLDRRVPLLPVMAATTVAELLLLAPLVPLFFLPPPFGWAAFALAAPILAAANAATLGIALQSAGRPRAPSEKPAWDMLSVPPPPAPDRVVPALPEDNSAETPLLPGVIPACAPYRLVARSTQPMPPVESRGPARAALTAAPPATPLENDGLVILDRKPAAPAQDQPARVLSSSLDVVEGPEARALTDVIGAHMPQFQACYERALKANSNLAGKVVLGFTILPDGRVTDVHVESDSLTDPSVGQCVVRTFSTLRFAPTLDGQPMEGSFPMGFHPAD